MNHNPARRDCLLENIMLTQDQIDQAISDELEKLRADLALAGWRIERNNLVDPGLAD